MKDHPLILIVEDKRDVRDLLVEVFGQSSFRVAASDGSADFAVLVHSAHPDVILSDVVLGAKSGFALAAGARSAGIPILLMSGHPDAMAALEASDFPHIFKPFRMHDVVKRIRTLFREAAIGPE